MELTGEVIKKARAKKGYSQQEVADFIGVTKKSYQYYEGNDRKPKIDKVNKIKEFLEIDKVTNVPHETQHLIPYYDVAVSAGVMLGIDNHKIKPDAKISVPGLNDCDLAVNVWGDSMYPKYCSGEIVVCKSVPMDKELTYVRFGEAYVVMCDDGPVVKYIKKGKDEKHLCFESENKHYEAYQVSKGRIQKLYLVKGVITRKNF